MGYMDAIKEYRECILIRGEKIPECRKRLIEQLSRFLNNAFDEISRGQLLKDIARLGGAGIGLVRARARLVYRARPGSSEFLLPLEWGLLVHPVFMIPYFPGSAVKGAMRASYRAMVEHRLEGRSITGDEKGRIAKRCAEAFFGPSPREGFAGIGGVVAFDAYPVSPGRGGMVVVGDVLTPHYSGLSGRVVTELDAKPTPIQGISVAEDTVFEFLVGVDSDYILGRLPEEHRDACLFGNRNPVVVVAASLLNALTRMGIGGKTTRGYGFFEVTRLEQVQVTAHVSSRVLSRLCGGR